MQSSNNPIQIGFEDQYLHEKNQYQFLRGLWNWQKNNSHQNDVQDKMDGLNKIIGMMKQRINHSIKKETLYQQGMIPNQITAIEAKALQNMNKAMMECQQYRTKLAEFEYENQILRRQNEELRIQNRNIKNELRITSRKIQNAAKQKAQLQNRILEYNLQQSISKRSISNNEQVRDAFEMENLQLKKCQTNISKNVLSDRLTQSQYNKNKLINKSIQIDGRQNLSILSTSEYCVKISEPLNAHSKQDKQNYVEGERQKTRNQMNSPGKNIFCYQKDRNLLKAKSINKHRYEESINSLMISEQNMKGQLTNKFVRQISRKNLLRNTDKSKDLKKSLN